jgi:hypothetical protein
VLLVEHASHLLFRDDKHGRRGQGSRGFQANGMTGQGALPEEVARSGQPHDGLFTSVRQHRQLDGAFLDVEDAIGRMALGEYDVCGAVGSDGFS